MAVPKKRTGHSAQGHRRSNWKATKPETTKCPSCGATVLTHTVCTECGTYKGQPVRLKDRQEEAVKEVKPSKKSSKKADSEKAVKAEETVVTEDTANSASETAETQEEVKTEDVKAETSEESEESK